MSTDGLMHSGTTS